MFHFSTCFMMTIDNKSSNMNLNYWHNFDIDVIWIELKKATGLINLIVKLTDVEDIEKYKEPLTGGVVGVIHPTIQFHVCITYWEGIVTCNRLFKEFAGGNVVILTLKL